jgi:hypothetical protein
MVNRTKISKEIRRRTGGAGQYKPPTAAEVRKAAAKQKTNLSQDEWERVPGSNPPKYRLTEEARTRRRNEFKAKQALKREEVTKPAVEDLYKGVKEGAPYARLTGAVRRGSKKAQLERDIASRDIDDYPAAPGPNRSMIEQEVRRIKALEERNAKMAREKTKAKRDEWLSDSTGAGTLMDVPRTPDREAGLESGLYKKGGKVSKSKGGTVKKKHGGKLHKKKTRQTYERHDGGKYVANLYD